jgi:hypothetical protein
MGCLEPFNLVVACPKYLTNAGGVCVAAAGVLKPDPLHQLTIFQCARALQQRLALFNRNQNRFFAADGAEAESLVFPEQMSVRIVLHSGRLLGGVRMPSHVKLTTQVVGKKLPHYELFGEDIAIAREALKLSMPNVISATSDFVDKWVRNPMEPNICVWPTGILVRFQVDSMKISNDTVLAISRETSASSARDQSQPLADIRRGGCVRSAFVRSAPSSAQRLNLAPTFRMSMCGRQS